MKQTPSVCLFYVVLEVWTQNHAAFFLKKKQKKTALQPKDADVTVKTRNPKTRVNLFFLKMLINSVFLRHQPHGDPPV